MLSPDHFITLLLNKAVFWPVLISHTPHLLTKLRHIFCRHSYIYCEYQDESRLQKQLYMFCIHAVFSCIFSTANIYTHAIRNCTTHSSDTYWKCHMMKIKDKYLIWIFLFFLFCVYITEQWEVLIIIFPTFPIFSIFSYFCSNSFP